MSDLVLTVWSMAHDYFASVKVSRVCESLSMEIAGIKLKTCKSFVEIVCVASLGRNKFRTDEKVKTKKKCKEWEEM